MSAKKTTADNKRRSNYAPWWRLFKRLTILAVIAVGVVLLWKNWDRIAPEALLDWTEQQFGDAEQGEGFPTALNGNEVIDMAEVNQHLAVLSDTTLRFYNGTAACVAERSHSFSKPTMHTAGKYTLLTEVGGGRFRLDTRRETVLEKELENRCIYAADLLSNGTTALILNNTSQSYVSEVAVLNIRGNIQYTYQSSKYLLTDVALSPNGKQLAAVGTTSHDGKLKSVLLVVTLSNNKVSEYTGTDVLLHNVTFFSGGSVIALGDTEIWALPNGADKVETHSCEGYEPVGYTASASLVGVAMRHIGATDNGVVWVFDSRGRYTQSVDYQGSFRTLSARGGNILLLTNAAAYTICTTGLETTYEVPLDCLQAVTYRGTPLLLTLNELRRMEIVQ